MLHRATQDGRVMVESSEKTLSTGEGNGKPLHCSCLENPMKSIKRQKDMTLKDELPRSVGAQYATGEEWRNNSTKNEETKPKQKQCPVVNVTGDESKVRFSKEQCYIRTWNVRFKNQVKLEVVKQEIEHQHFRNRELKWTGMGKFNSDDHYINYCVQESLRKNGVALIVNKSLKCSSWVQSQKQENDLC